MPPLDQSAPQSGAPKTTRQRVESHRANAVCASCHRTIDPLGFALGLNGVILLAYVIAIPANEIVIPTVLMLTVLSAKMTGVGGGAGVIFELDSPEEIKRVLTAGGWTVLTGVNLMLFSLLHNPCSTTIYTIYKETRSARWAALSALLPLAIGFAVTALVAFFWRALS